MNNIAYCTCGCSTVIIFAPEEVIAVRTQNGQNDIARLPLGQDARMALADGLRKRKYTIVTHPSGQITADPKEGTLIVEWRRGAGLDAGVAVGIYYDNAAPLIAAMEG